MIPNDANGHVAALEQDPPAPPAVAHEVVRGGGTHGVGAPGPLRVLAGQFQAIPVLDPAPPTPDGRSGVLSVRPPPALLPGEQAGDAGGVHHPAGADGFLGVAPGVAQGESLFATPVQFDVADDADRPADLRTRGGGSAEHLLVKHGPIHLEAGHARVEPAADLGAIRQTGRLVVGEPEAQALFAEVMLVEVGVQTEDTAEEVGADLHRALANPAGESRGFLHDQDARGRILLQDLQGGGGPGEGAPDDGHVVGGWRQVDHVVRANV